MKLTYTNPWTEGLRLVRINAYREVSRWLGSTTDAMWVIPTLILPNSPCLLLLYVEILEVIK